MLEILFTESAAGGLKIAGRYGKGEYKPGVFHFIVGDDGNPLSEQEMENYKRIALEKEKGKWEKAVPMEIDSKDVVALPFGLSTGDISEDYPGEKRQAYMKQLMAIYPEFDNSEIEKWFGKMQCSLGKVVEAVKNNQPVRLWYSDNPDELCGLYHLVYLIDKINPESEVYTVKLPGEYVRDDGTIINYNGWGGVSPEEWHLHFKPEKMTEPFKVLCVTNWRRLKGENATVRSVLNGMLHSLPEDIFDSFITKEINKQGEQFHQAMVIGNVLGRYQLGVGDAFIAMRMENMIEKGMLTVVQQAEADRPVYHRILKKIYTYNYC